MNIKGSLVGFIDPRKSDLNYCFEINKSLSNEEIERLREFRKEYERVMLLELERINQLIDESSKRIENNLEEYKDKVKHFLLKQDLNVKELPLSESIMKLMNSLGYFESFKPKI